MLPKRMGLRALTIANAVLLPLSIICSLASNAAADMIKILGWEQKSTLSANIFDAVADPGGYDRLLKPTFPSDQLTDTQLAVVNSDRLLSAKAEATVTATATATRRSATGDAAQTVGKFELNRNRSMMLDFTSTTSAALVNTTTGSDQVSVVDYFKIDFITDRPMQLALTASANLSGELMTEKYDNSLRFYLRNTGAANGFQDIEVNDENAHQTPEGAILPAGSYELFFETDYNLENKNVAGNNYQAGTNFNVNFAISAVPEPSCLAGLLFASCCVALRRKR